MKANTNKALILNLLRHDQLKTELHENKMLEE